MPEVPPVTSASGRRLMAPPRRRQRRAHAAVDQQGRAVHERRVGRDEEGDRGRDVRRAPPARAAAAASLPSSPRGRGSRELVERMPGVVSPGQTAFARTPRGPPSTASICVSMTSAPLRDRVRADRRLAPDAGVRGDQRDRPPAGRPQRGRAPTASRTGDARSSRERVPLARRWSASSGAIDDRPGVEHEGVEPAERLGRAADRRVRHRRRIARVGRHERRPVLARRPLAPRCRVAAGERDRVAIAGQPLDDGGADAGRAARDEHSQRCPHGPEVWQQQRSEGARATWQFETMSLGTCRPAGRDRSVCRYPEPAVPPGLHRCSARRPREGSRSGPRTLRERRRRLYARTPAGPEPVAGGARRKRTGGARWRLRSARTTRVRRRRYWGSLPAGVERARSSSGALLHRHRRRADRGDAVQQPGRRCSAAASRSRPRS